MTNSLSKTYDPASIEQSNYDRWEKLDAFAARVSVAPSGEESTDVASTNMASTGMAPTSVAPTNVASTDVASYCIMIPPPNVTGSLHMGHAFQDTIMDLLTRYHRMCGRDTLWQGGTDHAGIATQMVVERQLAAEGKSRHDLGRDTFIDAVWQWKHESGGTIEKQLRRMGASIDWTRTRFTMDEGLSTAVRKVFVQLYEEGLIYRGKRLVNWDPVLHTAVSDLEVESKEENGSLWSLRYPISDATDEYLVVATTRPETMLGDSAVAVHPEDIRFQHLVGKTVDLPLTGRKIPIIADEYVDPEFGSGCVKITPAHDFNDYEVGKRHDLPLLNILDNDAAIALPGSPYHGLDRYEARKQIISDLQQRGLLDKIEPHQLVVPRGDRSAAVIEPFLTDQWYVKVESLAKDAIDVVENKKIQFVPENWQNTYFEWMRNIEDWCISRQIWWGHRIPAWYDLDGNIYVAEDEAGAQQQAGKDVELRQDQDVLDTWFSSALWPFSTLGWPQETPELNRYYPTSVLVTGFDIIFFWVARMIMFGTKFMQEVPFKEVFITGLVRDFEGQKMSKSKGNVLDPIDIIDGIDLKSLVKKRTSGLMRPQDAAKIEKRTRKEFPNGIESYGCDALRFSFASQATQGRDIRFDISRINGYRNFCNKLWNAARFILLNCENQDCGLENKEIQLSLADRWIISRLQQVEAEVIQHIDNYRFDQMAQILYQFSWDEFCSWYIEMSKVVLNDDEADERSLRGTRHTLVHVLETLMRLLHPLIPFISEEIWLQIKPLVGVSGETVMLQSYPQSDANKINAAELTKMHLLQDLIGAVRNIRAEMNIPPAKKLPLLIENASTDLTALVKNEPEYLKTLGQLDSIQLLDPSEKAPEAATAMCGSSKIFVPLGAFLDAKTEIKRLQKEQEKLEGEITQTGQRLNNSAFVANAPTEVVDKARAQLSLAEEKRNSIMQQLERWQAKL